MTDHSMDDMIERIARRIALEAIRENGGSESDKFAVAFIKQASLDVIKRLTPADLATLAEGMGLAVVPVDATYKMKNAGRLEMPVEVDYWQEGGVLHCKTKLPHKCVQPESIYNAMLAAARIKPGQEGGGDDQG